MKFSITFLLSFLFCLNVYSSELIDLTIEEKKFIKQHPVITLAGGDSFEPFLIKNGDGSISGYDKEIAQLIEKFTGLTINFELGPWNEIQAKAKKRLLDGLSTSGYGGDREKYYNYTLPYSKYHYLVFVKNKNPKNIISSSDFSGKKISVQKGNVVFTEFAKQFQDVEIVFYDSMHDVLKAVISNEVDFTFFDETAYHLMQEIGLGGFIEHVFTIGEPIDVVFSLRNDWPLLTSIFNKAIARIDHQVKERIKNKWLTAKNIQYQTVEFSADEETYLRDKSHINLCVDPNWLPYTKIVDGKHIGIGADILSIIESKLPLSFKLIPTKSWHETLKFAQEKKCDVVDFAIQTKKRETYLNFTSTYIDIPIIMATRLDTSFIVDFKSLKNKKIGIVKEYAFSELLKNKYSNFDMIEVDSIQEGLQQVKDGKLFGYIGTLATVAQEFKENFTGELKISGQFEESFKMGSAIQKDDEMLLSIMQKVIDSIEKHEIDKITNKWISIPMEKRFDYMLMWKILGVILIISALIIYRQYLLKKQNRTLSKLVSEKTAQLNEMNQNLKIRIEEEVEKNAKQQEQLFKQSKLTSMAELISNIAHQWRQSLTAISSMAYGVKQCNELEIELSEQELLKNMDTIINNSQYLSETINVFSNFSKEENNALEIILEEAVDFSLNIVRGGLENDNIELINHIDYSNPSRVLMVQREFSLVIVKMINNAKDILVEREIKNKSIKLTLAKTQNKAILTIEDNAGGIEEEFLLKIFDPYFTTKHQSRGVGLGLYVCYKIITENIKGDIYVENTDKGAKFFIELPLVNKNS